MPDKRNSQIFTSQSCSMLQCVTRTDTHTKDLSLAVTCLRSMKKKWNSDPSSKSMFRSPSPPSLPWNSWSNGPTPAKMPGSFVPSGHEANEKRCAEYCGVKPNERVVDSRRVMLFRCFCGRFGAEHKITRWNRNIIYSSEMNKKKPHKP